MYRVWGPHPVPAQGNHGVGFPNATCRVWGPGCPYEATGGCEDDRRRSSRIARTSSTDSGARAAGLLWPDPHTTAGLRRPTAPVRPAAPPRDRQSPDWLSEGSRSGERRSRSPVFRRSGIRLRAGLRPPSHDFASTGAGAGLRGFCVSAQNLAISSLATRVRSGEPSMWAKASTKASKPGSAGSSP